MGSVSAALVPSSEFPDVTWDRVKQETQPNVYQVNSWHCLRGLIPIPIPVHLRARG